MYRCTKKVFPSQDGNVFLHSMAPDHGTVAHTDDLFYLENRSEFFPYFTS